MTECERLVDQRLLPEDFFREEVRNDFTVDGQRKKIWAVELDLLNKFNEVCIRNGLRYFLFLGTLLGAIRHGGFIPWDDDVDVAMPRDDFEKLLRLSREFKPPYFLQTPWTDPGYWFSFPTLRNCRTSFILKENNHLPYNHGIPLDFHPLDAWCPDENGEKIFDEIMSLAYNNGTIMRMGNPRLPEKDKVRIQACKPANPLATCQRMKELGMSFHGRETRYVCRNTMGVYGYKRNLFYVEDFRETIPWKFEHMTLPVPIGYDRILRTLYGDYMKFPPKEKRGAWHDNYIVDPDRPYTDYLE